MNTALTIVVLLAALALVATIRSWWRTRLDKDRCPSCHYPKGLTPSCSECGGPLAGAVTLARRRRVRSAVLHTLVFAFLALAGGLLAVGPESLIRRLPDDILIAVTSGPAGYDADTANTAERELVRRLLSRELADRDKLALLIDRVVQRGRRGRTLLRMRPEWPRGVPMRAVVADYDGLDLLPVPTIVDYSTSAGTVFYQRDIDSNDVLDSRPPLAWIDPAIIVPAESYQEGLVRCVVRVTLGRYENREIVSTGDVLSTAIISIPVAMRDTIADVTQPLDGPAERRQVESAIVSMRYFVSRGKHFAAIGFADNAILSDVAVGVKVSFHGTGVLLGTGEVWFANRLTNGVTSYIVELKPSGAKPNTVGDAFVRLQGAAELAIRDPDRSKWWAGSLDIPVGK